MNKVDEIGDSIVANEFVDFVPLIQVKGRFTLIWVLHFNPSVKNIEYFEYFITVELWHLPMQRCFCDNPMPHQSLSNIYATNLLFGH